MNTWELRQRLLDHDRRFQFHYNTTGHLTIFHPEKFNPKDDKKGISLTIHVGDPQKPISKIYMKEIVRVFRVPGDDIL